MKPQAVNEMHSTPPLVNYACSRSARNGPVRYFGVNFIASK